MSKSRLLYGMLVGLGCLVGAAEKADAAKHIIYLQGRSMRAYPTSAYLGADASWTHVGLSYDGSARLSDTNVRNLINNTIATRCGGANECVIVCYSAGCNRMLLAFQDLKAEQRYPAGILWSQALSSAAGGSENAEMSTKAGFRLLAKIVNAIPGLLDFSNGGSMENAVVSVDDDLRVGAMRGASVWGTVQNQATKPVYHMAGSVDKCTIVSAGPLVTWYLQTWWVSLIRLKLCGNDALPEKVGDGAVAPHSAAGYADAGVHRNHNDGGPKYLFRAYEAEHVALLAVDHFTMFTPGVFRASLRLGVNKNAACPAMATVDTSTLGVASIVYDDGDGAATVESSPSAMLSLCGENVLNGDGQAYGSCLANSQCCTAFSTGDTGGCTCGEALCIATRTASASYFTGPNCSGVEYSEGDAGAVNSWDGLGKGGLSLSSAPMSFTSFRLANGSCYQDIRPKVITFARRIYRPGVASLPQDVNAIQLTDLPRLPGATRTAGGVALGTYMFDMMWGPPSSSAGGGYFSTATCALVNVKKTLTVEVGLPSPRTVFEIVADTNDVSTTDCTTGTGVSAATRLTGATVESWDGSAWRTVGQLTGSNPSLRLATPLVTAKLRLVNLTGSATTVGFHELMISGY